MNHHSLSRVGIALLVLTSAGFAQNYFSENFNSNSAGWTLGPEWAIGAATASGGQAYNGPDPSYDATGTTGGGVAGVVIGGNASTAALHPYYYLTSPVINIQGVPSAFLNFGTLAEQRLHAVHAEHGRSFQRHQLGRGVHYRRASRSQRPYSGTAFPTT